MPDLVHGGWLFRAGFDLQMDQLTVVMLMVVTGVGFLIHIYSTGYMAHEGGYYRFFFVFESLHHYWGQHMWARG